MILAAIPWLVISIRLLLFAFVIISLLMILLILMQRPKQEGLGAAFGGGVTDQVFGARTTNVLQRGTIYLASLFFILSLLLSVLISRRNNSDVSLVRDPATPAATAAAVPGDQTAPDSAPAEPATPAPTLAEQLGIEENNVPADESVPPAENPVAPPEESPSPVEEATPPVESSTPPVDEIPAPAEEVIPPAEEVVPPAGDSANPEPQELSEEDNSSPQ